MSAQSRWTILMVKNETGAFSVEQMAACQRVGFSRDAVLALSDGQAGELLHRSWEKDSRRHTRWARIAK
jgi:hypothetical protein